MKTILPSEPTVPPTRRVQVRRSSAGRNRAVRSAFKLKRIMVPIDFSPSSRKALRYAASLAHDYGASVTLIHVSMDHSASDESIRKSEVLLESLAREEITMKLPITTLIRVGDPFREIAEAARESVIDLMVISTHSRAGFPDFALGSTAEQIVRYAPCPVLMVRVDEHDFLNTSNPSTSKR